MAIRRRALRTLSAADLARMTRADRIKALDGLDEARRETLRRHWPFWAMDGQVPPPGDWRVWLLMAGRGFGKTRCGAEWVRGIAEADGAARIALVAATLGEARAVIVAVALGDDGQGYVIEDASVRGLGPEGWARTVALAAARHGADRIVAEANNGGAMVESVLRAADAGLPVRLVHASHGKVARAEPVTALYEKGRVRHVGAFPALEDELCGLLAGGAYVGPGRSPDRADALVWALSALLLTGGARPGLRVL